MAEWIVRLEGNSSEISYLSELTSKRWKVTKTNSIYYLKSIEFNSFTEAHDVLEKASNILDILNGIARLVFGSFQGVKVGGIGRAENNGKPPAQYILPEGITTSVRVGTPRITVILNGREIPQQYNIPGSKWIEVAEEDEKATKALTLYGGLEHNWKNLYMILEVIEDDVGGERKLINKGWTSKGEIKRFKRTADNYRILGREARHGTEKWDAPREPMSLGDAESLIRNILDKWLCSKYQ